MKLFQALFSAHRSLSLAGLLFGTGLLAVSWANPAIWLQSGFETALNTSPTPIAVAAARKPWTPPIAGSESYWLGSSSVTANKTMMQPATWQAPVAKGDRFTISSGNTTIGTVDREFEVVTIEPLLTAVGLSEADKSSTEHDQFLVICRSTDKHHPEVVKFLLDSTSGLPWATAPARTAQAL